MFAARNLFCRRPIFLLVLLACTACVPTAIPEPTASFPQGDIPGGTPTSILAQIATLPPSPSPDIYPPLPTATYTLPPYPWPTATLGPTEEPTETEEPTPTEPPVPTLPPTPVVTLIPTVAAPYISFPEDTTSQPFTLYYRDGDVILSLSSETGAEPQIFLDPLAELGLYLPPRPEYISDWGAMSPDGQTLALVLTNDPVSKMPEGATDAFSAAPHPVSIYLLDMAGRELRLLVPEGFIPVWSPDGSRIAYRSTKTLGLWVVDVITGEAREVYGVSDEHFVRGFTWASDNRHLSLIDDKLYETTESLIVDANGLEPPRAIVPGRTYGVSTAEWSPVDQRLVFTMTGPGRQPVQDLWLMNSDGTAARQLTHDLNVLGGRPQWSPDGRWIAFSAFAAYESEYSSYDLWLSDPADGALQRLTYDWDPGPYDPSYDPSIQDSQPQWSPDGIQLLFFKSSNQVWLLSLIDGRRRQLLESEDNLYDSGLLVTR